MDVEPVQKEARRGIYLLPNLFTTAGLFAGFYAIVAAMKGYFDCAAIGIFVAMILDGLDGRIARLTNTESAFGAEYDSLSDMVAFGVAPALIVYTWGLSNSGKLGWITAFLYVAAGAMRLARFNTQLSSADKRYFRGLNIPSAAAVVTSLIWLVEEYVGQGPGMSIVVAIITLSIAGLMVSSVRYHSFKSVDFRGKVPFVTVVLFALILASVAIDPPPVLFAVFSLYALSGPVLTLWGVRQRRKQRHKKS